MGIKNNNETIQHIFSFKTDISEENGFSRQKHGC